MPARPTITCEQQYSRKGLGYLWDNRTLLDSSTLDYVNKLWRNKKKGSIICTQSIEYSTSMASSAGKLGYGRYYSKPGIGLERIEKEARGTLCQEYYYDIDMVNCHPTILIQYAKRVYNKDLPNLQYYVDHREEVLKKISENRDEAKDLMLKIINGGKTEKYELEPLSHEIRGFVKMIASQKEHSELWEACRSCDNRYGSFMAEVLQTEETTCLLAMKKSFERQGWTVDVLAYDGVMVRKRLGTELTQDVLAKVQEDILTDTSYLMKVVNKPFQSFEMPEPEEEIEGGVLLKDYLAMKELFEKNHFLYAPTNEYVEVNGSNMMMMEKVHAQNYFMADWAFVKSQKFGDYVEFFPIWNKDRKKRMIHTIDYKPTEDPTVFVKQLTFTHALTVETRPDALPVFLELADLCSGRNPVLREYMLNWYAHLLQQPFDLPGVGLIFTGQKGVGKDTLNDFMLGYVVGESHGRNYENSKQFFAPHDTGRRDKFFVKLEEANREQCMANADWLKGMVTSKSVTYNPKGSKEITTPNYLRLVLTLNPGRSPVDLVGGERRWVFFQVPPTYKGNLDHWGMVRRILFNPEAGKAVAEYLLKRDLSGFNVRKLPENEFLTQLTETERSSEELFLESSKWDGSEIAGADLFQLYTSFCLEESLTRCQYSKTFTGKMMEFVRDNVVTYTVRGKDHTKFWIKKTR